MELFPYEPRRNQVAITQTLKNILNEKKDIIFESGTGSGKTICALASTIEYALENNKKIIYTTRTNAQQRQVILELREIRKKLGRNKEKIFGIGLQGRGNMCLLAKGDPKLFKGSSEELSKFCSNQKRKVKQTIDTPDKKGCSYYRTFVTNTEKLEKVIEWVKKNIPTVEELIAYCEKNKLCPYEVNKQMVKEASLVVVPYIYVFDLMIRNLLFDLLAVDENDMILIVDEAHNLPNYIRDLYSTQLSSWMLNNCILEAEKYGDPSLSNGKSTASGFCKALDDIIRDFRDTYIYGILENGIRRTPYKKSDAFIPSHEFETEILSRFKITSKTLTNIVSDLIAYGEKIQEYRQKEDKIPRSYLHSLGLFLDSWISLDESQYVRLVVDASSGKNPRIEAFCLDPAYGAEILKYFHSTIHMSGTLEPLEEYRDSMGLPEDTYLVSYPSPFSKNNRKILFVSDVTTKFDEITRDKEIIPRMKKYIAEICNSFSKNTMVFFPSFDVMASFRFGGLNESITRSLYVEERGMSQSELMGVVGDFKVSASKKINKAAMFSVMGGRISEGLDFPAEELEIVVIVGIPYPKPTARQRGLQQYYDMKFRKGWEYIVEAPTARKLLQSIGRLIRDEKDRGIAIILDRRAPRFKQYIKDLEESKNLMKDMNRFMES